MKIKDNPIKWSKKIYKNFKNLVYFIANRLIFRKVNALIDWVEVEFNSLRERTIEITKIKSLGNFYFLNKISKSVI